MLAPLCVAHQIGEIDSMMEFFCTINFRQKSFIVRAFGRHPTRGKELKCVLGLVLFNVLWTQSGNTS
jgi:hypothetical protein